MSEQDDTYTPYHYHYALVERIEEFFRNKFPNATIEQTGLGLGEESGEVLRAILKRSEGIRGTKEEWNAEVRKEVGDVFARLVEVAMLDGFDLWEAIEDRFAVISERDINHDPVGPVNSVKARHDKICMGKPYCQDGVHDSECPVLEGLF